MFATLWVLLMVLIAFGARIGRPVFRLIGNCLITLRTMRSACGRNGSAAYVRQLRLISDSLANGTILAEPGERERFILRVAL